MEKLAEYTVMIGGIPHTMLLTEEDARARGVHGEQPVESDAEADLESADADPASEQVDEKKPARSRRK